MKINIAFISILLISSGNKSVEAGPGHISDSSLYTVGHIPVMQKSGFYQPSHLLIQASKKRSQYKDIFQSSKST